MGWVVAGRYDAPMTRREFTETTLFAGLVVTLVLVVVAAIRSLFR